MVWVLTWSYPYDGEHNTALWQTKADALSQACSEIMYLIEDEWDMSDLNQASKAQEINNLFLANDLEGVLECWNTCEPNCESKKACYWYVEEKLLSSNPQVPVAWTPDFFVALCDEEEEEVEEEVKEEEAPFIASTPGATCRGSHAEYSPDAYADKSDGTYLCYL